MVKVPFLVPFLVPFTIIVATAVLKLSPVAGFALAPTPRGRHDQHQQQNTPRGKQTPQRRFASSSSLSVDATPGKDFGTASNTVEQLKQPDLNVNKLSTAQIKDLLVDLLPRMTGQDEEFRTVESYVNMLEDRYQAAQTLDFLNLAMQGEWQLLFSTNLASTPNPTKFRLRELIQIVECNHLEGVVTNRALWDLAQDTAESGDSVFDATGTFSVQCTYEINQGARMLLTLQDHVLQPARGSKIPTDVPALVGLLHQSMPKELFDPSEHAVDTTYLDGNLKIARYTGPRLEGVRDIFIRRGALEVDPAAATADKKKD